MNPVLTTTPGAQNSLDALLAEAVQQRASDVEFQVGEPVAIFVDGRVKKLVDRGVLSAEECALALSALLDTKEGLETLRKRLFEPHDCSVRCSTPQGELRFRLHAKKCCGQIGFNLRHLVDAAPDLKALGTPDEFVKMLSRDSGLILVTGAMGSGKTTTLAASIAHLNATRNYKIATYEAPIEIQHRSDKAVVQQHEVGPNSDIATFEAACEAALRENAKVIMLGELRSLTTIRLALELADTGHLVLGTLHTGNAIQSISRLIDSAPVGGDRSFTLNKIATNLIGSLSQRLVPAARGKAGRRAIYELMIVTDAIYSQILQGNFAQLNTSIETGRKHGMFFFEDYLSDLTRAGEYTVDEVLAIVANPVATLKHFIKRGVLTTEQQLKYRKQYGLT